MKRNHKYTLLDSKDGTIFLYKLMNLKEHRVKNKNKKKIMCQMLKSHLLGYVTRGG